MQKHDDNQYIDLTELFIYLYGFRKKIIGYTFILAFLTAGITLLLPNWYASYVTILPSSSSNSPMGLLGEYASLTSMLGIDLGINERFDYYPDIVKSNYMLDKILSRKFKTEKSDKPMSLFEFWEEEPDTTKPYWQLKMMEDAKRKLREKYIEYEFNDENNILTIRVLVPGDRVLPMEICNFIVEQLEIYNKNYRKVKATEQRLFIEKRLEEVYTKMSEAEHQLLVFMEKNKSVNDPKNQILQQKLETEYSMEKALFLELKKQLEIVKINEIKDMKTLDILDYASLSYKKYKPKRSLIVIVFTILGFVIITSKFIISNIWQNINVKK